jgi:hypothetical protein
VTYSTFGFSSPVLILLTRSSGISLSRRRRGGPVLPLLTALDTPPRDLHVTFHCRKPSRLRRGNHKGKGGKYQSVNELSVQLS